jgi:two-component system chemotaxis response regulator CheB
MAAAVEKRLRDVEAIVLGGSAGALSVLKQLTAALEPELAVPVLVVLHVGEGRPSAIAGVLARAARVRVHEAEDKERLEPGTVYVAPPGYHMLVERDHSIALSADAPEHYSRPSIDVLFESAADAFGAGLIGVLLSGASSDGTRGLKLIHEAGGVTFVQAPSSAEQPIMPQAALDAGIPAVALPPDELALIFSRLRGAKTLQGESDV